MVQSLGLTLYKLRFRKIAAEGHTYPTRPDGRLIWLHAPSVEAASGLRELSLRLVKEDGLTVLMTCPEPLPPLKGIFMQAPPEDSTDEAKSFLDHWRPEVCVFSDGELRPAILHEAAERGLPMVMVDGRRPYLLPRHGGWYPGLVRSVLQGFRLVLTVDEAAARSFRKEGAAPSRIDVSGRMEEDGTALPCLEAERAALAKLLATRPVWLAAGLPEAEEAVVIAAHRAAQSLTHRLMLIIAPENPARAAPLAAHLADEGDWIVSQRAEDQEPEPDVEIYVTDGMAEMGLWYRLAPITFLGGSLAGQGCARNPFEPAALGSAILYGPRPGAFGRSFGRLGAARAARAVGSATDLAEALSDLLSPDRAARLAQAAWAVASDGAEVTERVLTQIRQILKEQADAPT